MPLPEVLPMPLVRVPEAFDAPDWIFEAKIDGFRALAYVENGACRLVSRNNHVYKRFRPLCEAVAAGVRAKTAILDGEIAVLDGDGRSQFNRLMFNRGLPILCAFDLLWVNGRDLRGRPLIDRKARLAKLVATPPARFLLVDYIVGHGRALFDAACMMDLEGVVGKLAQGSYRTDGTTTSWVKIKNPAYSQTQGRREVLNGVAPGVRRWVQNDD